MDFSAILANMESKRSALEAAINSLRAAMAAGALGVTASGEVIPVTGIPSPSSGHHGIDIPNGAFHGKTVTEAIKAYLGTIKKKQKTRQIVEALKKGGIESSSDKFLNIVYNALSRMQTVTGEVVKVGTEWGLSEWFPPGMRAQPKSSSAARDPKNKQKRPRKAGGRKVVGGHEEETIPRRIEEFLISHPETVYTPSEIAAALGIDAVAVNVRLKRMVARGRVVKQGHAQYRAGKPPALKLLATG
jgi:hypothetical protein